MQGNGQTRRNSTVLLSADVKVSYLGVVKGSGFRVYRVQGLRFRVLGFRGLGIIGFWVKHICIHSPPPLENNNNTWHKTVCTSIAFWAALCFLRVLDQYFMHFGCLGSFTSRGTQR